MTLILNGITRTEIVSTEDENLMERFVHWLHEYQHYVHCNNNEYFAFSDDKYVLASIRKARRIGLIVE